MRETSARSWPDPGADHRARRVRSHRFKRISQSERLGRADEMEHTQERHRSSCVAPWPDREADKLWRVELGVHLPLMRFGDEPLSLQRLHATVDTARDCGFAAISANDHFAFQTPWLDGPTALASMIERSGKMTLATTVSLAVLRGPVALAKALAAIDVLSEGRLVAALGPGSSERDYRLVGIDFEERWKRFD